MDNPIKHTVLFRPPPQGVLPVAGVTPSCRTDWGLQILPTWLRTGKDMALLVDVYIIKSDLAECFTSELKLKLGLMEPFILSFL